MRKTVTEWEQISASWLTDERLTPRISYGTAVKGQPTGNEWRIHRTDVSAEKTLAWPISTCKGCANCAFSIPASRQGQAHDVQRGLTSYPRGRPQSRRRIIARADERQSISTGGLFSFPSNVLATGNHRYTVCMDFPILDFSLKWNFIKGGLLWLAFLT